MKSLRNILTFAALSLFAVSCVEEADTYVKGEADVEGCYGVYFPAQEAAGAHTYDPSMPTEITFTLARTNSKGEITVPVVPTASHDGIFEIPAVTFADGQAETQFTVTFPNSENGIKYSLSLAITDPQYASKYNDGATNLDFSVLRVEWLDFLNPVTNEPAKFTFTQGWWDEEHTGYIKYYDVNGVRTCQTVTDPMDYEGEIGYGFWGTGEAEGEGELTFTWYSSNYNENGKSLISLPVTDVYLNPNYNAMVKVYDYYTFYTVLNPQPEYDGMSFLDFAAETAGEYPLGYYDNGGFYFYTTYYYMSGIGGWSTFGYEVYLEAEGFTRVDYSLALSTGLTADGAVPVTFELGPDVAKVKYAAYEGELNVAQLEAKVAAISDGTETAVSEVSESSTVAISMDATGKYTLVAVAFDAEGNVQNSASTVFTFVAADSPVPVIVSAGLGSADKYVPSGASTETSLEFWVYGQDLVEAKVGVFTYADLVSDMEGCQEKLLGSDSISADAVALANGEGYVDVVSGLVPGTEHYLLVWASNSYETTIVMSNGFYTSGDPLPVYKNYSSADFNEELLPSASEGYFGTYNYYAVDYFGDSPLRGYLGQVTVSDSELPDAEADDYGLVAEYVNVKGIFGSVAERYGFDDTMVMEYYGGVLYQLSTYYDAIADGAYYPAVMYLTAEGGLHGANNNYTMFGGFVDEGYIAFVDATGGYGFNGWLLRAFSDAEYATSVGNFACYQDVLLVDPAVDDNGLAPAQGTSSVSKAQLDMINAMFNEKGNCVETERGRIHSIIDSVKGVRMFDSFMGIKGEREVSSVSFKAVEVPYAGSFSTRSSQISTISEVVNY